ncbi:MAG: cell division protein FtsZ [Bacteroidaceae bacterium]|nr:cell division protein FtsZ [Bacteroidaceae bacterium]MBQ8937797.1 cell division protein FtsZ [Bacteroidaceae bacterium]MBR0243491.1 cell division protein FtsZ [Bacteroidaceae bacterium]
MADSYNSETGGIQFNLQVNNPSIIKVVGVGGGGGNAVTHMYNEGIHDVTYVLCNTDNKALTDSPVPNKLQMGEGLGAGNKPEKGRQAALESIEQIKQLFTDGTRMAFITAGMGGGTGTGAAPIVAQCAREMDILTVGIVTIPFRFEGHKKIDQALDGVEEMSKHVDALLVINNELLRQIYPELTVLNGFAKADDTLSVAAKSIAEIITMRGIINLDFQDVKTVLKDGGVAIMSTGYGEGENRVTKAFQEALHSPLLNNNDIYNSKKVLFYISFSRSNENDQLTMEEMNEVNDFMAKFQQETLETKWGMGIDDSLGNKVKITLLASGFGLQNIPGMEEVERKRTREEEEEMRKREELREQNEDRRRIYYTDEESRPQKPRRQIFIFSEKDLDNDDIISMVESTPTAERNKAELKRIQEKAGKDVGALSEASSSDASGAIDFTITF